MKPEILLFHPPTILDRKALKKAIMSQLLCGYGLLHLGSHLKEKGYSIQCWNIPLAYQTGLDNEAIKQKIKNFSPLLIGIELNWLQTSKGALDLAQFVKSLFPNTTIIMGGVHSTIFADSIIQQNPAVDIVVKGEAEKIIEEIACKIEKNQNFYDVVGTVSKREGKVIENPGKNIYEDIDVIPAYSFDYLMPKTNIPYHMGAVNTCRGPCKYNCTHCLGAHSIYCLSPRETIQFHSIPWLINQIQILLKDVNQILIQDDSYANPKFLKEFAKAIEEEQLKDSIDILNIALVPTPEINKEVIEQLARAGFNFIDFGIESGSDKILKLLNRPYNSQQAMDCMKNAIKNELLPLTYWMITGFESNEDLNTIFSYVKKSMELGAIPRWVTPICILPKTQLANNAADYGLKLKLSSFEDFCIYSTKQFNLDANYPECITHETDVMSIQDILHADNALKTFIIQNQDLILKNKDLISRLRPVITPISKAEINLDFIKKTFF
jgi:radical SAM superfamily enzyme YgiQ (UPF0313 family)